MDFDALDVKWAHRFNAAPKRAQTPVWAKMNEDGVIVIEDSDDEEVDNDELAGIDDDSRAPTDVAEMFAQYPPEDCSLEVSAVFRRQGQADPIFFWEAGLAGNAAHLFREEATLFLKGYDIGKRMQKWAHFLIVMDPADDGPSPHAISFEEFEDLRERVYCVFVHLTNVILGGGIHALNEGQ